MKDEIKSKLEECALRQLNDIQGLAVGGELHSTAVEDITATVTAIQDIENAEREALVKKQETKREAIIKSFEAGVSVGTLAVSIAALASREKWIRAGFELERTGTFTVQTFKTIFNSMFKK